jgi:RNA polymerase sigma-70 factor (ECF subfamily)
VLRPFVLHAGGSGVVIPSEARGAWRELEARLRPYVARRVTSASDVDDVVQDVFVRIHRGIGELDDAESFGGWVYGIARRAVVDHVRSRSRHALAQNDTTTDDTSTEAADSESGLEHELSACVALFVSRLSSPYREAVTLTELQGMTQREAAEMLGIPLSTMKSQVQRGRTHIRRMFDQCCEMSVDARGRVLECTPRELDAIPSDCRDVAVAWATRHEK